MGLQSTDVKPPASARAFRNVYLMCSVNFKQIHSSKTYILGYNICLNDESAPSKIPLKIYVEYI